MKNNRHYCFQHIQDYYEKEFDESKENHQILGWESREAQHLRFFILTENVELSGRSLLDVGCGLGDLFFYIQKRGINLKDYHGVDICKKIISKALKMNPEINIECRDIFSSTEFCEKYNYDLVYSSGIFNLKQSTNLLFLKDALMIFKEIANEYVVFNLLSDKSNDKEDPYCYYSVEEAAEIVDQCSFQSFKIVEDYLQNDFTVVCKKQ
ncbi:MAG: class I SAM-dependent methyltransferase [Spirochaetes bacterium]|nr:class I SAM-dependent methyltransferase [Spirochaetota bacterium]